MTRGGLLALGALIIAGSNATLAQATPAKSDDVAYGCNDLVVVGRLEKQDYQHVEIEDDLLGHGWITADLRVDDVVFGARRVRNLPVKYFAHTYMREDRDFVFVLRPAEDGRHLVRTARLMENDPELADHCG
jgi:hypothetical protein